MTLQVNDGEYLRKGNINFQIIKFTKYQVKSVKIHQMLVIVEQMKNVKDKERILKAIKERNIAFKEIAVI